MTTNSYKTSIQYNPNPPRVWSRVQNPCSVIAYKSDDPAASSNFAKADYERQMLLKGNILQYKKNSSNLTKKQRYTQIAKGMWTNRTKTWATQSDTYTNPNMTSLLRVNYTILDPSNNNFSNPQNPFGCPTTTIQDGGNLVCNRTVNPCTQEIIKKTVSQKLCNPTTDSDVPGQIQPLCWNDGTQTWYPRQRYIMPTSGTKWPQGYKGFTSALTFVGPILSTEYAGCGLIVPLSWTFLNSDCAPITSFNIYQNGILVLNVPVSQTSVNISELTAGLYSFYVTSLSNSFESEKSNIVNVNTEIGYIITGIYIGSYDGTTVTILFNTPGTNTIESTCNNINNCTITCIGGGGGGGGGSNKQSGNPTESAGGGGGGGGVSISTGVTLSAGVINYITVGSKGTPGNGNLTAASGTNSSFNNAVGNVISYGGGGGKGHYDGCGGGAGGSASITSFVGTVYNGGNGGNGYQLSPASTATNGSACGGGFSGGGGGGIFTTGGGAGNMGNGGINGISINSTGISATSTSYGSGGGGAGCPLSLGSASNGGSGANGAVIIQFTYP
jgi:hypothetical protein